MRRARRSWCSKVLIAALPVALSACGVSGSPPAAQSQSSRQLLAATNAALGHVHSLHLAMTEHVTDLPVIHVGADITLPGRMRLTLTAGQRTVRFLLIGNATYAQGTPQSRWVAVPTTLRNLEWLSTFRALTHRSTLARCLLPNPAAPMTVVNPTTSVGGTPAIALGAGGHHGLLLDVATGGSALPLREKQSDMQSPKARPARAPARPDRRCGAIGATATKAITSGESKVRSLSLNFGSYDWPMHIKAPANTITLAQLGVASKHRAAHSQRVIGPAGSSQRSQERAMLGTWQADGRMIRSQNLAGEPAGTLLPGRLWVIETACTAQVCRPYILRSSPSGAHAAPLVWNGAQWTATFTEPLACSASAVTTYRTSWSFRRDGSTLTAIMRGRGGPGCGGPLNTLAVWSAHRLSQMSTSAT